MTDADPHEQIAQLETQIESLAETVEGCRKIMLVAKVAIAGGAILVVVSLDPHHRQEGWLSLDLRALGAGYAQRRRAGDVMQLGGACLVDETGRVLYHHRGQSPGDLADPSDIVQAALALLAQVAIFEVQQPGRLMAGIPAVLLLLLYLRAGGTSGKATAKDS